MGDDCDEGIPALQRLSTAKAPDHIAAHKNLVFAWGISEEHADYVDSLQKTVMRTAVKRLHTSLFVFLLI